MGGRAGDPPTTSMKEASAEERAAATVSELSAGIFLRIRSDMSLFYVSNLFDVRSIFDRVDGWHSKYLSTVLDLPWQRIMCKLLNLSPATIDVLPFLLTIRF